VASERTHDATTHAEADARSVDDRRYLLVFAGDAPRVVGLDDDGSRMIGRARDAHVHLADPAVSREHARVDVAGDSVKLADLGSNNGTRVNGERVEAPRLLWPGDVITIGRSTLVYHHGLRGRPGFHFVPFGALRSRLDQEVERAVRFDRDLALIAVHVEAASGDPPRVEHAVAQVARGVDAATWSGRGELLLLLPECDADDAALAAARLRDALAEVAPGAGIGVAACPDHGADGDVLIAGARAAALGAGAAQIARGPAAEEIVRIGGQAVIVADAAMARVYALIDRLAPSELPVLVRGETGTGKELAATALHERSPRARGPLVALNCAALAEGLVESELFGHDRGAFSGAVTARAGLLEAAAGGTVFLDEIGELSPAIQAKLLRALDTRRITRVGEVRERPIDIRLIAATHRDLRAEVETGRFRRDLYYRLCGAEVELPPLRERPRDLPRLAHAFLDRACAALGRAPARLGDDAVAALAAHDWPGNVRELRHLMDYVAAAVSDPLIRAEHLRERLGGAAAEPAAGPAPAAPPTFARVADELRALEIRRIREALDAAGGIQTQAAKRIGMPLRTLAHKIKKYGIVVPR
jgi:two-component system, NtrC family, response regulator AtoC